MGNAFVRIVREDGAAGLFRGATPTIVRAMALNMGMLASNEQVGVGGCVGVCMRLYVWMGVCGCYFVRAMALSMGMLASNKRVCVCVWVRLCVWIGVWVFVCVSG